MFNTPLILYEEESSQINLIIEKLKKESSCKAIFLVNKNGQMIAECGELKELDTTSLASLTAGNIAATGGLAKLLGESEFSIVFHEGRRDNIHISIVGHRVILVAIFDESTSIGLVRLKVKSASRELEKVFKKMAKKAEGEVESLLGEISEEDIENLFKGTG